jgi:hypothetical protein
MAFDHVSDPTMRTILTKNSAPTETDILYGLLYTGDCQSKDLDNPDVDYTVWALRDGALTIADEHFEKREYDKALHRLRNAWSY